MTSRTHFRFFTLIAWVSLLALLGVACGANAAEIVTDGTTESATAAFATDPADSQTLDPPATAATENTASSDPATGDTSSGGHDYGTSIDDWATDDSAAEEWAVVSPAREDTPAEEDDADALPSIQWQDLIPAGASGQEIMVQFEERLATVEPGSDEATVLYEEIQAAFDDEAVNEELDGQKIRLAGFVAPLTFEGDIVTEFLLVPTFGACIHVPAPPPNQTVMVSIDAASGLTTEETWGPVWVEGTLEIQSLTTELAEASYVITGIRSGVYEA